MQHDFRRGRCPDRRPRLVRRQLEDLHPDPIQPGDYRWNIRLVHERECKMASQQRKEGRSYRNVEKGRQNQQSGS